MDQKDEIRAKTDIVELIQEYIPLKQAGSVSWKGLCPFHGEKTPSFHVSRDKQIWHCFGCSEGGDCFAFVMRMEGMDFPEALRHLGQKVGIEVTRFSSTESNDKQRLVAANEFAAKFYRKTLVDSLSAANARAYLEKRGIPDALAEAFGLGVAPDAWDTLALAFAKKQIPDTDGERAGLLMRRKQGQGFIDRFRNRIMIPLRDAQGSTIGFTGRVFVASPHPDPLHRMERDGSFPDKVSPPLGGGVGGGGFEGPKYMNSPETPVYHKGSILFGLDLAKKGIREKGSLIIVEGNLDVIASHKAGITNIVASSGTALTEAQLQLIKRYTTTIIFSFDADAAGFKAAQRGIALARQQGFDVRVAVLPASAGKDPDEAVQKDPALWRAAVEKTVPIMQYYLDRAVAGRDLDSVDAKRAVASFLLPEFAHITDVVEREHWLQILSDLLRTDLNVLRQAAGKAGAVPKPASGPAPKIAVHIPVAVPAKTSREDKVWVLLVGIFVNQASFREKIKAKLPVDALPVDSPISALYKQAVFLYDLQRSSPSTPGESLFVQLRKSLEDAAAPERATLVPLLDAAVLEAEHLVADQSSAAVEGHVRQLIEAVASSEDHRRRKALEDDLRRAERAGNKEEVARLLELYRLLS